MKNTSYKSIVKIAAPMLAANLSIPLLGLVDTAILGHLDQATYLAATALGAQLIGLMFWSFGFLRMGTTGFTSRALGAEKSEEIQRTLHEACFFGATIGLALVATHQWSIPFAMQLLTDKGSEISELAIEYSTIRVWAAPAALITYALIGWLIGLQQTRSAMYVLISTNLLNILLDYLLIIGLEMNSAGAAWASLISEYTGLLIASALAYKQLRQYGGINIGPKLVNWSSLSEMFSSSRHLFVRTVCLLFVFLFFASQGSLLGENTLASNAILLNLLSITAYAMDGFAYAAETLCGHAWGDRNRQKFISICRKTTLLAAFMGLGCSLILWVGQPWILGLYTDLPEVREAASTQFIWLALLPLIAIWCYQLDGIFIGVGQSVQMQNAMLAATLLIYLPTWWFTRDLGNQGLWVAFVLFHIARSAFLAMPFVKILGHPQISHAR